jgi:hypothetical protein
MFALAAFLLSLYERGCTKYDNRYAISYLISLLVVFLFPVTLLGFWVKEDIQQTSIHMTPPFPIIVLLIHWVELRLYGKFEAINLPWLYLGTMSSIAVADVVVGYHSFTEFTLYGVGGAGFLDAIFILPIILTIYAYFTNKVSQSK